MSVQFLLLCKLFYRDLYLACKVNMSSHTNLFWQRSENGAKKSPIAVWHATCMPLPENQLYECRRACAAGGGLRVQQLSQAAKTEFSSVLRFPCKTEEISPT